MPEETPVEPWLKTIEDSILNRLKPAFPSFPVEASPERDFNFTHTLATILVAFTNIKPGKLMSVDFRIQELTLAYEVVIFSRSLRTHTGIYLLIVQVLALLQGWTPAMGNPLTLTEARYLGQKEGSWAWSLVFETEHMLVPVLELADPEPPMTDINIRHCMENCECHN